jgi:Terminase DNA packaging enzyme
MNINDTISKTLGLPPLEPQKEIQVVPISDVEDDYEYARNRLRSIMDKGEMALDEIMSVASQSQQPRAYEVVATMVKTLSDSGKDLLELSKRKQDLQQDKGGPSTVNNNLFVGSTSELLKMLKKADADEQK